MGNSMLGEVLSLEIRVYCTGRFSIDSTPKYLTRHGYPAAQCFETYEALQSLYVALARSGLPSQVGCACRLVFVLVG